MNKTRQILRTAFLASIPLWLGLTAGCLRPPTEKPVYREAKRAILASMDADRKVKVGAIDDSHLYIGKSAARADLPVMLNEGGEEIARAYTVVLRRVARTWVATEVMVSPGTRGNPYRDNAPASDPLVP